MDFRSINTVFRRVATASAVVLTVASCGGDGTGSNPCVDSDCDQPPASFCRDGQLVTFVPFGTCVGNACDYAPAIDNCPYGCDEGACLPEPDACDGVTCSNPPDNSCEGDTALVFGTAGTCVDGACDYPEERIDCATDGLRCLDGQCITDCEDADCTEPPAAECDGDTAIVYAARGSCVDAACSYADTRTDCSTSSQVCSDGACVTPVECPDTCDEPPADVCSGASAITYEPSGVCDEATGECIYERTVTNCLAAGGVCIDAECVIIDLCAGITCLEPPTPECQRDVAVTYIGPGECDGGECVYSESVDDCGDRDEYCFLGSCQSDDPCDGVSCGAPPASRCESGTAIAFTAPGTCAAGECSYAETRTDCTALGLFCNGGTCTDVDPCEGVSCNVPPADYCNVDQAQQYLTDGVCDGGICRYTATPVNCRGIGRFCFEGECQLDNPCTGVTCDAPPADRCEGAVVVEFGDAGTCFAGECSYNETRRNCSATGGFCRDGDCVQPDACAGVTCDAPPAPRCDGDTRLSFAESGTCNSLNGLCSYTETRENCSAVDGGYCFDGACAVTDPCVGRICATPPAASCEAQVAVRYALPGVCADGRCSYIQQRRDCAAEGAFCASGQCVGTDPCLGVSCEAPPAATCDGDTVVSYSNPGACQNGLCFYTTSRTDCAADDGYCSDGACQSIDPCLGLNCVTPPGPVCDGNIAVGFANTGTCAAGECSYAENRTNCSARGQFCFEGLCQATDPCAGVTCNTPPGSACSGDTALDYDSVGVCVAGDCVYSAARTDCAALTGYCFNGACEGTELCDDVTCNTPTPASYCDGNTVVRGRTPGTCRVGVCAYTPERVDCGTFGEFCYAGACQAEDPCDLISCNAPPADRCNGDTALDFSVGICELGTCDYVPTQTDCAANGQYCANGACTDIDPCLGLNCNSPPGPVCSANTVVSYTSTGVCNDGVCSYGQVLNNCASTGRYCLNGRCQLNNPCNGVNCNRPPAAVCDGDAAVSYATAGTCAYGVCSYNPIRTDCGALGGYCSAGTCQGLGLCDGVVCDAPPQDFCDGALAVEFADGVCRAGSCDYAGTVTDCDLLGATCLAGRCVAPEACDGVSCDTPPVDFCDADVAVQHLTPGTCALGGCSYSTQRVNCAATGQFCSAGACVDRDPCLGTVCVTPNDPFCDANTVVSYAATGVCTGGACRYDEIRTSCGSQFCNHGACQATNPCAGVSCNAAPPAACDGNYRVTYPASGTCAEGECNYTPTRENCGAVPGGFCFDAACGTYDLCEFTNCNNPPRAVCNGPSSVLSFANPGTCDLGVCDYVETVRSCNTPPANTCDGNTTVRYTASGTCTNGVCGYSPVRTDCGLTGQFCSAGTCQDVDPCVGLTCSSPPPNECDANVAVAYANPGTCAAGECGYPSTRTDCSTTGRFCFHGSCQNVDPCFGVSCSAVPPAYCDGGFAVSFANGVCSEGECDFTENRTDCAAVAGGYCNAGACLVANPCDGVACNNPPANVCEGASTVLRYAATGTCGINGCTYGQTRVNCTTPPVDTCDGDFALDYTSAGTCAGGACTYNFTRTDCAARGQFCDGGVCSDYDRCLGVACDTPPGTFCDGQTAVTWASPGTCSGGVCDYVQQRSNCTSQGRFCLGGACVNTDPCAGITCNRPPRDYCNVDDAVAYEATGTCAEGICRYDTSVLECDSVANGYCLDGDCYVGDPCEGVTCINPPAPVCAGNVLTRYLYNGTCTATGACDYPTAAEVCDEPPANTCDGDIAVAYASVGSCGTGNCTYSSTRTNCAAIGKFCGGGLCRDVDPCLGLNCLTPPDPFCEGNTRVTYATNGICANGDCEYAQTRTACGGATPFCNDGACQAADPCAGVTCSVPSVPTCEGDTSVIFTAPGTCSEGECSFGEIRDDCSAVPGGFCDAGFCSSVDLCADIECNNPPARSCSGATLLSWLPIGVCDLGICEYTQVTSLCDDPPAQFCEGNATLISFGAGACSEGNCVYSETTTDCAASGRVCRGNACVVDPCLSLDCSTPPAPLCQGEVAVSYGAFGTCINGACSFVETRTECDDVGLRCRNGACYAPSPCDNVACTNTPTPTCDGTVAVSYFSPGICNSGSCSYPNVRVDCAEIGFGGSCADGACESVDPCEGIACDEPPDSFCFGETLFSFQNPGICSLGACSYSQTAVDCTATGRVCDNGACIADPCDSVTCASPPDPYCTETPGSEPIAFNTRTTASSPGLCTDGLCTYPTVTNFDCTSLGYVCSEGACVDESELYPCAGVVCSPGPISECDGNVAVTYQAPGICTAGVCDFPATRVNCAATGKECFDGFCIEPPTCEDVVCTEIPPDACRGTVLTTFDGPGVCDRGVCLYTETELDCADSGQFCANGACTNDDPCDVVVCNEAGAAFCDGSEVVTPNPTGTCLDGQCSYGETRVDCALTDESCYNGQCTDDPCSFITCNSPQARCEDDVAITSTAAGVCVAANLSCDYSAVETRVNCAATGDSCFLGACVDGPITIAPDDIIITEVYPDAPDADTGLEWFELLNTTSSAIDISGMIVRKSVALGDSFELPVGSVIAAGGRFVIGESAAANAEVDYAWGTGNYSLANDTDSITIEYNLVAIDTVFYNAVNWPYSEGVAMQRSATAPKNDSSPGVWCPATTSFLADVFGTPGLANDICP